MCGIAGFVGEGSEDLLRAMTRTLQYRGPDGEGYFFDSARRVGLGHRRLSIIDLEGGSQPMSDVTSALQIVFNGEIYNFQSLRQELSGSYHFQTHSDTEVILAAYSVWGEHFLEHLDGMFALALWDARSGALILARDRFGEKPLFWTMSGGTLIFASELKAIHAHSSAPRVIDRMSLAKYLVYEYVPAPHTIWQDIQKLEAGHMLVCDTLGLRIKPYYSILDEPREKSDYSEKDLEKLLDDSVQKRLVADVPIGVFLSGGIDSTTIAYFAQLHSRVPVKTFSIGFEDPSFDESEWARKASKRIGTDHHEKIFTTNELLEVLPVVAGKLDEPLADPSLLPTFLLSHFTREHVTVALGGDGGDELLLGYPTFRAHRWWRVWSRIPSVFRRLVRMGARLLPVSHRYFSFDFKVKKFLDAGEDGDGPMRNQLWLSAFLPSELDELLCERGVSPDSVMADIGRHARKGVHLEPIMQIDYLYLTQYLSDDILAKVDRASMFNSLEVRAPFLGRDLSEFLFHAPVSVKQEKRILKKLMAPKIGRDIAYRQKKGFGIPLSRWLSHDLEPLMRTYLDPARIEKEGFFRSEYVSRLVDEHKRQIHDHRKRLWALLMFQLWYEHYGI